MDSSSAKVLLSQKPVPQSIGKTDDPAETLRKGEAAYQRNREDWDRLYSGQYIAIYQERVVAADFDKTKLLEQLIEQQKHGKFRAYIVHVGAPVFQVRGPHPSQRGRNVSLPRNK